MSATGRCLSPGLEVLLEGRRLGDGLAGVGIVDERLRVAGVEHAAGARALLALARVRGAARLLGLRRAGLERLRVARVRELRLGVKGKLARARAPQQFCGVGGRRRRTTEPLRVAGAVKAEAEAARARRRPVTFMLIVCCDGLNERQK